MRSNAPSRSRPRSRLRTRIIVSSSFHCLNAGGRRMPQYRSGLPQLSGDIFLTDAGVETDLIFNHGIEIREFAAHTLLPTPEGRAALARYFEGFLRLAKEMDTGFILDSVTWKAHAHWASSLHASRAE